jgi:pimeloyl-ACP methyl ester carboxylesterase
MEPAHRPVPDKLDHVVLERLDDNSIAVLTLMAASIFPKEIYRPPRARAEALWPNLIHWNELDRGGHFAAFEQPELFVEELRRAFRNTRNSAS